MSAALIAVRNDDPLNVFDEIEEKLATLPRVEQAVALMDQADALRRLVRHAVKGFVAQNRCCYIKLLAQHRAGELLAAIPRAARGGPQSGRGEKHSHTFGECLAGLGIRPQTAWLWEQLASVPQAVITAEWQKANARDEELTAARVHAIVREHHVAERDNKHPCRTAYMRQEQAVRSAHGWLQRTASTFLSPGTIGHRKLAAVLSDRVHVSREEVSELRASLMDMARRLAAACDALVERMEAPMASPLLESIMTDEERSRIKSNMRRRA